MAFLTYSGANTGSPNTVSLPPPAGLSAAQAATFRAGAIVVGESGCLAATRSATTATPGPGPAADPYRVDPAPRGHRGDRCVTRQNRCRSFKDLALQSPAKFRTWVNFLSMLQ